MVSKITFIRLPDNSFYCAKFDTLNARPGEDFGCRVKHYIYKDEETGAYWHERVWLSRQKVRPKRTFETIVSKRKFWGKVRLIKHREACMPETWDAVAQIVKVMEGGK